MKKIFKFSIAKWLKDQDCKKILADHIQGLRIMERKGELYIFVDGEAIIPLAAIDLQMRDKLDAIIGLCRKTRKDYRLDLINGNA